MAESTESVEFTKDPESAVLTEDTVTKEGTEVSESDPVNGSSDVQATVGPEVAYIDGTGPEARALTTLKKADAGLQSMTTAGKKPVELFKSLDSDALEAAMAAIKSRVDGEVTAGPFLLTEIDHWDIDRERILFLTEKNFYSVRYDFVNQVVSEVRTIPLVLVDELAYGEIYYPKLSAGHTHSGNVLKVSWGKDHQPSFMDRWNPFSTDIRCAIYQSHPIWKKGHSESPTLSVKEFIPKLQEAVGKAKGTEISVGSDPVYQGSYWGLGSLIHNQSELGFSKRRGGVDW